MSHEKYQTGGILDPRRPIKFFEEVNFDDTVNIASEVKPDDSQHFFDIVGTLPINPNVSAVHGERHLITSAGSSTTASQTAVNAGLLAGYTGDRYTRGGSFGNAARGTGTTLFETGSSGTNSGLHGEAIGTTTGTNDGVRGVAFGGNVNLGMIGQAVEAKNSAINIGGAFFGRNTGTTPIEVGAYAGLNTSNPTFESAALVADNAAVAAPIILARDDGITAWSVQDGGSLQGRMATKNLSEGVATAFVRFTLAANSAIGGLILYSIEALDGVDQQIITGVQPFAAVNKAGTVTPALGTPSASTEIELSPVGSLTNAFDTVNAANTFDIRANATSSLAQTTLRISYQVHLYNNAVITVANI